MFQTTDPKKPGYMPPIKPHAPKPMQPRGTVTPPKPPKKASGKERKAIKDRAARLVEKTLNSPEWFVIAYRIDQETGAVEVAYEMCNYPHNAFEESAQLYADILTQTLGADFDPNAAQKSEAGETVAETGAATLGTEPVTLPNNLGGHEPPETGQGEPD